MGNILSAIERNIVISLFFTEHIPIHFLFCDRLNIFRVIQAETGLDGVSVSPREVIVIKKPLSELDLFAGKEIIVVFFFHKLKLSFIAPLKKNSEGLEIAIPHEITRLTETMPITVHNRETCLRFTIPEKQNTGNSELLSLLFICDKIIALSGFSESFPLQSSIEYPIQITRQTEFFDRSILASCYVGKIYTPVESKKNCAICVLSNLKAEDRRFLFEKHLPEN